MAELSVRELRAADLVECERVKTRRPSTPDEVYERTRHFYLARGFEPLFETLELWGPEDAALILVKRLQADEIDE